LSGVRVADFSWVLAGPISARHLAAMGAEVIKVETTRRPDQTRAGVFGEDGRQLLNQSPNFNSNNYSKLSCTLDLTNPAAQRLALDLVRQSDIVLENFGYGVMERFGLGYETLRAARPDIIMLSSSGLGRTGPDRGYVAYGQALHAYSGLTGITGYQGGPPRGTGNTWADPLTAITAVFAMLAALHHRNETGEGQFIDLSMGEAVAAILPEPLLDYQLNGRVWGPRGNDHDAWSPHNCYRTSGDDQWIAIVARNDDEWQALCRVLDAPELAADARFASPAARLAHRAALDAALDARTRAHDARALTTRLQAAGVPAGPTLDAELLTHDPHVAARGFLAYLEHPEVGARPVTRLPWLIEPAVTERYIHAPLLGQHNEYVFQTLLGLTAAEYQHVIDDDAIR
jgi:benzylsuccinate CoA-transferase BbsF subunit